MKVHDSRLVAAMTLHHVSRILTFNTQDFARYLHCATSTAANGGVNSPPGNGYTCGRAVACRYLGFCIFEPAPPYPSDTRHLATDSEPRVPYPEFPDIFAEIVLPFPKDRLKMGLV